MGYAIAVDDVRADDERGLNGRMWLRWVADTGGRRRSVHVRHRQCKVAWIDHPIDMCAAIDGILAGGWDSPRPSASTAGGAERAEGIEGSSSHPRRNSSDGPPTPRPSPGSTRRSPPTRSFSGRTQPVEVRAPAERGARRRRHPIWGEASSTRRTPSAHKADDGRRLSHGRHSEEAGDQTRLFARP